MGFRKTIGAKPFYLLKTASGKFRIIAALYHAFDHFMIETVNIAILLKGGHCPPKLVCFCPCKACPHNGNFHGLFLK